jgi:transcriptional regulator with XRE-family HTH domain
MTRQSNGKFIAQKRKSIGKTQGEIAKSIRLDQAVISKIENGKFSGALSTYERYLNELGLEIEISTKEKSHPQWDELEELFSEDNE